MSQESKLLFCGFQLRTTRVPYAAAPLRLRAFDHKADGDAGLDTEHVVLGARQPRIGAYVAAKIDDIDVVELSQRPSCGNRQRSGFR